MGRPRRLHRWGASTDGGSPCLNCGLVSVLNDDDWYRSDTSRAMVSVEEWRAPSGDVVRIRPMVAVDAPKYDPAALTVAEAFPNAEVGGVPDCPKKHGHWDV